MLTEDISPASTSQTLKQQLAFLQLADSFFPSGSYTLSHGLESLVQANAISHAEQLETFVRLLNSNKVGSSEERRVKIE